mgnify:CR=1 FL=1
MKTLTGKEVSPLAFTIEPPSHLTPRTLCAVLQISIENLDRSKDTIMDIKKKVEEKEGISPEQQR